jgi:PST family polysaccharide transporter
LVGFGTQKIVAVFYGPTGTTLFAHFQNFVALFTQPVQDAVANGLINAFPKNSFKKSQILGAAVIISFLLFLSTGALLLVSHQFNHPYFSFSLEDWLLIFPSILAFCFGIMISAIYISQKKLKLYATIILLQWIVFIILVLFLDFELRSFLIFWLFIQSIFSVLLIIPIYSYLKFDFKIDGKIKVHFKQFLIMALTIWITSKWVDYYVRDFAIQEFGATQTGLWQSVVRISDAYRGLMTSFLFLSFYPMISQKIGEGNLLLNTFKRYYFSYIFFSLMFLLLVFQFKGFILELLYNVEYMAASNLLQLQIAGDFFAFLAFPFSIYLIASIRTKTYVITELLSASIFVVFIVIMSDSGIESIVYAHIFRFICYLVMVSTVGIKSLRNDL